MTFLSDATLDHLREVAGLPDLSGTRYRMVGKLGEGGMGVVYAVFDPTLDREVALKVVNGVEVSPEILLRLEREARVLARLEHPGIVPVHECGLLPDGRAFYVMKLVRGERLDEVVRRGAALPELLRAFERICQAVAFAHAHGVVHRDLKPENIMVGTFGEVLVMDWGVAKLKKDPEPTTDVTPPLRERGDTAHGTLLGTPAYMAPEQLEGQSDLVDEVTDVYALGAILYFILAHRPPVDARSPETARRALVETPFEPPRRWMPDVPRRLEAIALKAMSRERLDRYPSVGALAKDVERYLAGERVEAYRETALERTARWAHKYRTPLVLVLAYLAMRTFLLFFFRL